MKNIIIPIAIMLIIFYFMIIKQAAPKAAPKKKNFNPLDNESDYQPIPLLTTNEKKCYQGLKIYAAARGMIICPKIRLADLIEPKPEPNRTIWQKRFNMISSKHIDFALCDPDMNVEVIIELDDSSHNREDRQARDRFVNAVLRNSGYKIIHFRKFDDAAALALDDLLGQSRPEEIEIVPLKFNEEQPY